MSVRTLVCVLLVVLVSLWCVEAATLKQKRLFPSSFSSPLNTRLSTSDPANNPVTADGFLMGDQENSPVLQQWRNSIDSSPLTQRLDQQVLIQTRQQAAARSMRGQDGVGDAALLEQQQQWVHDGEPASHYEPTAWPQPAITPDPYAHLTHKHGGGNNEHNNIEGALGVQSASIPWDYRHYAGNHNTHRKAEPLIYTPLYIAHSADGDSAVDLTSILNKQYQTERMSKNPQYANTLSALTDYKPVQLHPTDHWLPQMPAPGVRNSKYWEKHFLDLYAPTPPPLLSPKIPRMKKNTIAEKKRQGTSFLEQQAAYNAMPDILKHGEHIKPMITTFVDQQQQPIPFHDQIEEDRQRRMARDINVYAVSNSDSSLDAADSSSDDESASFLEVEEEIESESETEAESESESESESEEKEQTPIDALFDTDIPFPPKTEEQFSW